MVWAIFADQESIDLLDAAAEMAAAALAARSRRVDQDDVISRSVDMSRIKLATLRAAFHQSPLIEWPELDGRVKAEILNLVSLLIKGQNDVERSAVWHALRAYVLRPGTQEPQTLGSDPWGDDDLPKPAIRRSEGKVTVRKAGVRKVRRKPLD